MQVAVFAVQNWDPNPKQRQKSTIMVLARQLLEIFSLFSWHTDGISIYLSIYLSIYIYTYICMYIYMDM